MDDDRTLADRLADEAQEFVRIRPQLKLRAQRGEDPLFVAIDKAVKALREAEEREKIARVWEWEEAQLVTDSFNQCSCGLYEYSKQRLNELRGTDE